MHVAFGRVRRKSRIVADYADCADFWETVWTGIYETWGFTMISYWRVVGFQFSATPLLWWVLIIWIRIYKIQGYAGLETLCDYCLSSAPAGRHVYNSYTVPPRFLAPAGRHLWCEGFDAKTVGLKGKVWTGIYETWGFTMISYWRVVGFQFSATPLLWWVLIIWIRIYKIQGYAGLETLCDDYLSSAPAGRHVYSYTVPRRFLAPAGRHLWCEGFDAKTVGLKGKVWTGIYVIYGFPLIPNWFD